ncbi:hypothetical protein STRDD10_00758 [Streptococcus sp. DD10]|uniref:DUF4352 domain-containing protein n=1 Tax=Streptococcus sp. DD10 TaxID=1777878 RepID=UPI0007911506|nr:DUF4352 domain-containing protein [Streptococcus sp. DD10]KXT74672.1 hypothetical protein STRDD10_00758 [Streptococcus sp. DD10]
MTNHIPKEIITDEGHVYHLQKPLHKQGWFWVSLASWLLSGLLFITLIAVIVLNSFLVSNGGTIQNYLNGGGYYQNANAYEENSLGEAAYLYDDSKLTVMSIQQDSKKVLADDATGRAVVVHIELENQSKKPVLLNPYLFSLFDQEGNVYLLDASTFEQGAWNQSIKAGSTVELDLIFDGEESQGSYHVIYDDMIRWWQEELGTTASSSEI